MRRRLTAVILSVGLAAGGAGAVAGVAAAPSVATPAVSIAKTCSAGYTHAVIGGAQKCLRRGEFCSRRYANQYPRYGYHCRLRNGYYRLS